MKGVKNEEEMGFAAKIQRNERQCREMRVCEVKLGFQ